MKKQNVLNILCELQEEYGNRKRLAVARENYIYYDGAVSALSKAIQKINSLHED